MPSDTMQTSNGGMGSTTGQSPERLTQAASGVLDQAGRTAETQASRTMDKAGEALDQVARAVRDSGNQLREQRPEIAGIADTAAEKVEQVSAYLREHDAREVFSEAERFARRQPALVVGGGLALGLVIGRLLRSGAEPQQGQGSSSYDQGQGGMRGYLGGSASDTTGQSGWYGGTNGGGSTPGNGYGTGYGTAYDAGTGSLGDTADNLAATDAAAGSTDYSGGTDDSGIGSASSRSADYAGTGVMDESGTGAIGAGTDFSADAGSSSLGVTGDDDAASTQTIDAADSGAMDVGAATSPKTRKRRTRSTGAE